MGLITKKIKEWYRGKYVPPPQHKMNDHVIFISPGYYEKSISARIVSSIIQFWLSRWPILLPVIAGSAVALFVHFDSSSDAAGETEKKSNDQILNFNHDKSP